MIHTEYSNVTTMMVMLLVSMTGGVITLPRSGFVQQVAQTDKLQLVRAPRIITNNNLPLSKALRL